MENTIIRRLVLTLPIFLGLAMTAGATPTTANLVINELSSTTLTYSWNGGAAQTETASSSDYWQFTVPDAVVSSTAGGSAYQIYVQWKEPDYATSGKVNKVEFYQYGASNGATITVWSDYAYSDAYPPLQNNGDIYTFPNPPAPNGNTVQFNDNGDTVPDGGMTVGLLGMALVGMSVIRRKLAK
jgi:hypothetical protein